MPNDDGPAVWAAYFSALVADQEDRKKSLEQRGVAVVSTSGAFVTLLFGLVALVTNADSFALPDQARAPIGVALTLLTTAALIGIATNWPRKIKNVSDDRMADLLSKYLDDDARTASTRIARTQFDRYASYSRVNDDKARLLVLSLLVQVAGLTGVAVAVREVLVHA